MQTTQSAMKLAPGQGRAVWVAGDLIEFKVVGGATGGALTLGEVTTPPGGGPPPHVHRREDETFYVLEGEYAFLLGDRTVRAGAGSVVYGPRHVPHTYQNVGAGTARMLAFATPAGMEAFLGEVGAEATDRANPAPFGDDEVAKLLAAAPKYGIEILPSSSPGR